MLGLVGDAFGAGTCSLWLLSPEGSEMRLAYERGADPAAIARFRAMPMTSDLPGPIVVRTATPVFMASQAERDERWPALAGTPSPSEALAVLPMVVAGRGLGCLAFGFVDVREFTDDEQLLLLASAEQCAIAVDRAQLYESTKVRADSQELLARVAMVATETDEWQDVAKRVTAACAERFVDWSAIYVREGSLLRRAAAASSLEPALAAELTDRFPVPLGADAPVAAAIRSNEPQRMGPVSTELLEAMSPSSRYAELARNLPITDGWALPLSSGPEAFGCMTFGVRDAPVDDQLTEVALSVAHRTASMLRAIDRFSAQRAAVAALYEVAMAQEPPKVEGIDVVASYVPFSDAATIGGDWWDSLALPDGRVALAVGDVVGHAIPTAAVMGQMRNAMRAYLLEHADPGLVLTALSRLLHWTHPDAHATAALALVSPSDGAVSWAIAGHPPPLEIGEESVAFWETPRPPPLGVRIHGELVEYRSMSRQLPAGSTVLLYTDGLVEGRRRNIDEGMHDLARVAARVMRSALPLVDKCEAVLAAMVDRVEDDICLVAGQRL